MPRAVAACGELTSALGTRQSAHSALRMLVTVVSLCGYGAFMVHYLDNPAGRLHKLLLDLHAAFPNHQQQETKQAWTAVVELVGNESGLGGEAAIISGVVSLPAEIREAVGTLSEEDERKEHLLAGLDQVEQGLNQLVNRQSLFSMFNAFATNGVVPQSAAVSSLSHCSYELHRSIPEVTISDDDLARIVDMLNELMREVAEADLPNVVKRAMLNHLIALLQAAHNVRFAGSQPLDDALFALTGSVTRTGASEDLARVGLWEKVKKAMQTLNLMLSTGQSAVQLGQGVAGFLDG
ncbi:hypothetical protein ABT142_27125 [Streptomyces sp. NPDC001857]|uniref:hypothetical protein n=1 Tax=unclassified Streptomyces TaxID=2593676 RepID=UPI00332940C8